MTSIAVIGAGVIGETLISAMIDAGQDSDDIVVVEKRLERAEELRTRYGVSTRELGSACADSTIVFLVVKPQDMAMVLEGMKNQINPDATVVSLAAGIQISHIEAALGPIAVIRVMPNTPAIMHKGMFVASKGTHCSDERLNSVMDLLRFSGEVLSVAEQDQDAVTALSGSGPAYVFLLAEAMQAAGESLGLSAEVAKELTIQTVFGAAHMLREGTAAHELREKVTSPNGTTAAALAVFEQHDFKGMFGRALKAARDRSVELSQ